MSQENSQQKYDFMFDLYADCMTNDELIVMAQHPIADAVERRAICGLLIATVQEDACHVTDDTLQEIHALACLKVLSATGDEQFIQHL